MELLILLAVGVACGLHDTATLARNDIKSWGQRQHNRWTSWKNQARARRSKRGHVRLRDLPPRFGLAGLDLLGWAAKTFKAGMTSGWRRRHNAAEPALAKWRKWRGKPDPEPTEPSAEPSEVPAPIGEARPPLRAVPDTSAAAGQPRTIGGPMSSTATEVMTLEQLKAANAAVRDDAVADYEDKRSDLDRAKADRQRVQALAEAVQAKWPQNVAAPYARMIEDAEQKVTAAAQALAAAETRQANSVAATAEVEKQVAAEEVVRDAGWSGGVTQAGPILTGAKPA